MNSIREQFIEHVESCAQTALEGKFVYARKGITSTDLSYDFELKSDKNLITFKAQLESEEITEVIEKDFGWFYNCPGNGATAWRCVINFLWYALSYDEKLYNEFMKENFNCDINDLHAGNF